jgi:hypothetical protein
MPLGILLSGRSSLTTYQTAIHLDALKGTATTDVLFPSGSVVTLSDHPSHLGLFKMRAKKLVASFVRGGSMGAFMHGKLTLHRDNKEPLKFPHSRVDLLGNGGYQLSACSSPAALLKKAMHSRRYRRKAKNALVGINGISAEDRHTARQMYRTLDKQYRLNTKKKHVQPRKLFLMAVKEHGKPVRAVYRMHVPFERIKQVAKQELPELQLGRATKLLSRLFTQIAERAGDFQTRSGRKLGVHLEAAVLHGRPMKVMYAGDERVYDHEGISMNVDSPL